MKSSSPNKSISRRDLIPVVFEYLLLVIPIAIYVMLEALHKHDWHYFFKSPEWGIATIFLSFQGVWLYFKSLIGKNRKINHNFLGLLFLLVVIITVAAILNSFISLDPVYNNRRNIIIRLILLIAASVSFLILTLSGRQNEK